MAVVAVAVVEVAVVVVSKACAGSGRLRFSYLRVATKLSYIRLMPTSALLYLSYTKYKLNGGVVR